MKKILQRKCLAIFLLLTASFAVRAADRNVPADYPTIQDAIDASSAGDVIHVYGTYIQPSGTVVTVNQSVTIQGESSGLIQTSGTNFLFVVTAAGVTIKNLEIEKTDDGVSQNIIQVLANNFELTGCDIHGQFVVGDGEVTRGLEVTGDLTGFNVHDNTFRSLRQPAYINNNVTGTITNNFVKITKGWVVVSDCNITFTNNTWGTGADANAADISFINQGGSVNNYPDIVTLSANNNDAVVENQHSSYPNPILSIVRVQVGSPSAGSNGTPLFPYPTIAQSVPRVAQGGKVLIGAGNYDEQVLISKGARYLGQGAIKPVVFFSGTVTGKPTLFDISADGVTIDNLNFNVDLSKLKSAIIASDASIDKITITNNKIDCYGTPSAGTYGDRNAVSINYGGPTNYRVATGGVDNIQFQNNTVTAAPPSAFRSGIAADEAGGTFSGNTLQTINHDVIVRFGSNGNITIQNNNFNGGGVEVAEHNAGAGTTLIDNNVFNATFANSSAPGTAVLRLRNNQVNKPFVVSNNTFTNHQWGISLENMRNVTVEKNSFTPLNNSTDFHAIAVNTKSISSNSAAIVQTAIDATIQNNFFYGSGTAGGTAIGFYNHDADNASFGTFDVHENSFDTNIANDIFTDQQSGQSNTSTFPDYNSLIGTSPSVITTMAAWTAAINGTCNWYGTNNQTTIGGKVGSSVTYESWLVRGTDSDPSTPGFQPVANSCKGTTLDNDGDNVLNPLDCSPYDPDASLTPVTYYQDSDGDGYGNDNVTIQSCSPVANYVTTGGDCDDTKASVHPGATEVCNGIDDNCDGNIDEGVKTTFYLDSDGDGYGDAAHTTQACSAPTNYVANDDDCDDSKASVHPGATEICGNGIDDDCDGVIDNGCSTLTSFTLINATSDVDITQLTDGAVINLATIPGKAINIRANTSPYPIGSVKLQLSGQQSRTQQENEPAYSLFGNTGNDYNKWTPQLGSYTLTATPYQKKNGAGAVGIPLTIHFTVIDNSMPPTPTLSNLTLINAATDNAIKTLQNGDVIDLLTTPSINIRANPTGSVAVKSVRFKLNSTTNYKTESQAPFAIAGDNGSGDYYKWNITPGNYTLTATPFSQGNAGGTAGTPITVSFTITKSATALSGLTLVNAATDHDIAPIVDGMVIDLGATPSINVRANPASGATVKSVRFSLNSTTNYKTESQAPFAIAGDNNNGDYYKWNITPGDYVLKATPYTQGAAGGLAGPAITVTIHIGNSSMTSTGPKLSVSNTEAPAAIGLRAYPNPVVGQGFVEFWVPKTTQTSVTIVDVTGRSVAQVYSGMAESGVLYKRNFKTFAFAKGMYFVRLVTGEGKSASQHILIQ